MISTVAVCATGKTVNTTHPITTGLFTQALPDPLAQDPLVTTPLAAKVKERGLDPI